MVKDVPEYDETAPSHIADGLIDLDVPFEASFGQDPRASRPQRSYQTPEEFEKQRNETIANYYGFPTAEAHAAAKEKGWTPYTQAQEAARKAEPTTAHEESPRRDSLSGCPAGQAVSVRSAVAPSALSPHDFTKPIASNPANLGAVATPRKPPIPVPEPLAKKIKGPSAGR
jgi:hypothetical protein